MTLAPHIPQVLVRYGRGDDWVGAFLLSSQPSAISRIQLLVGAPFMAGRHLSGTLSGVIASLIHLDINGFVILRALNVLVLGVILIQLNQFLWTLNYSQWYRITVLAIVTSLPGLIYWTSHTGSVTYLLGASAAFWAGIRFVRAQSTLQLCLPILLVVSSVFLYQPSVVLALVAPTLVSIRHKNTVCGTEPIVKYQLLLAPLASVLALIVNLVVVSVSGKTQRLASPTTLEALERIWGEIVPKTIFPWPALFGVSNLAIRTLSQVFLGYCLVAMLVVAYRNRSRAQGLITLDNAVRLTMPIVCLVLLTVPLAFTQPVDGMRVNVFSSVVFWTLVIGTAVQLHPVLRNQFIVHLSAICSCVLAAGMSTLFMISTVLPAAREWHCSLEASAYNSYPVTLPLRTEEVRQHGIIANDEWLSTSLELPNPARFQILASYEHLGIDSRLKVSIWEVPDSKPGSPPTPWEQTFIACVE